MLEHAQSCPPIASICLSLAHVSDAQKTSSFKMESAIGLIKTVHHTTKVLLFAGLVLMDFT